MNAVTVFFLRAKSWQVFSLVGGLFIVGESVAVMSLIRSMDSPDELLKVPVGFGIVTLLMLCGILGWCWAIGTFLSLRVPPVLRLKSGFFRFAIVYPAIYVLFFMWEFRTVSSNAILLLAIFPLHFFAMFCLFYLLYFVSKSLVLAERREPASFSDYAAPFFLIWFFPIGIWFIQPRINRQYTESLGCLTSIATARNKKVQEL